MPCEFREKIATPTLTVAPQVKEKVVIREPSTIQAVDTREMERLLQALVTEALRPGRLPWSYDGTTKSTEEIGQACPGPFRKDVIIKVANKTQVDLHIRIEGMDEWMYILFPAQSYILVSVLVPIGVDQIRMFIKPSDIDSVGTYHIDIV